MNTLVATLTPYVHALGWSLLHFVWQGALIGLLYALLRGHCAGSAARHRLGMFCLFAMLLCPLATLALLWPEFGVIAGDASAAVSALPGSPADAADATGLPADVEEFLPWGVALWLLGVCFIALRSFLHWRRLAGIVQSATALPRDWQLRLIELSQRFGILRPVRLLSSLEVGVPTLIGWLKPTILLPASLLSGFTPAQIELIIAHELAHVRRYDYIANLIQVVVETLLFYHPVVYWIGADVRQQREQCCDDLVLSVGGGQRMAYARTLTDLEEWIQHEADRGFGAAMPALGAAGGVLLARVRRIVDPRDAQTALATRGGGFALPVLLACAGLLLAVLRLNSASVDAVRAVLVRASATSAELLAAANFHIRVDAPVAALQTPRLAMNVVPQTPSVVEREPAPEPAPPAIAPSIKPLETAVSRVADVPLATVPQREQIVPAPLPAPVAEVPSVPAAANADAAPPAAARGPQPLRVVQPAYPSAALRNNMGGKVELEFKIGGDGSVRDVHVLSARPAGMFEQAAIAALRQWQFAPGSAPASGRYTRIFAFAPGSAFPSDCREMTGTHICRRPNSDGDSN